MVQVQDFCSPVQNWKKECGGFKGGIILVILVSTHMADRSETETIEVIVIRPNPMCFGFPDSTVILIQIFREQLYAISAFSPSQNSNLRFSKSHPLTSFLTQLFNVIKHPPSSKLWLDLESLAFIKTHESRFWLCDYDLKWGARNSSGYWYVTEVRYDNLWKPLVWALITWGYAQTTLEQCITRCLYCSTQEKIKIRAWICILWYQVWILHCGWLGEVVKLESISYPRDGK